ncbi:glycosyl hydrolases family 31-domain-containing protein [Parasitella parasitica]|nr:glycosyl hydrolases family 31-domain-containing protein [Parasitella parasitica]
MRQTAAEGFWLKENKHPFVFENPLGDVFKIMIISSNVIRIRYLTQAENTLEKQEPYESFELVDNESHYEISSLLREDGKEEMEIETASIRLVVMLKPAFQLSWYASSSKENLPFAQDLAYRSYVYDKTNANKWHYQKRFQDTLYYGLGERSGSLDLAGRRFELERLDCMGYDAETSDPLYKFCPFYLSLSKQTKEAYGIYYNNFSRTSINLGQELDAIWGPYTYYHSDSGPLDYYMIYGPSVSSVVKNYSLITSRPRHLPPRYSLGYLASSMGYAEAEDAQSKLEEFADNLRKNDIPCDGLHLSSGYTVNKDGDRCVFVWNSTRFPDPEKLAEKFNRWGIQIFANIKPWLLQQAHPHFDQLKNDKGFIWNGDEDEPGTVMQWRGGRNTMGKASYVDFSSQAGYSYWKSNVKSQLLDKGYRLWLDNNEFTLPDDGYKFACSVPPDGFSNLLDSNVMFLSGPNIPKEPTAAKDVGTTLQTLLMIQASYEAVLEHAPNQRPFLITRSATPYSNELVSQTWSGDNTTAWKTIKYNIPMGLGAGLCGMPAGYGHDVGGFAGPKPDPEMFVRWVQQGVFWPRFSIHSWNSDDSVTEPWMYPQVTPTIRSSIHFRYKIIPYIYTLYVQHAFREGEPLVRPVFYENQHDTATYNQEFDFMLGPSLLIAPVYEPNVTMRSVYLPSNSSWYHYQTGKYYSTDEKGEFVQVPAAITDEAAPFFVKAGSMMCFGKVMNNVHASEDDERRVQIFPERFDANTKHVNGKTERKTFILFEDDGDTLYHETGRAFAEIHIWMETSETEIHVGMDIVNDGFFPYYDTVWVTCPIASETRKLVFEGQDDENEYNDSSSIKRVVDDKTLHVYTGLKLNIRKGKFMN